MSPTAAWGSAGAPAYPAKVSTFSGFMGVLYFMLTAAESVLLLSLIISPR